MGLYIDGSRARILAVMRRAGFAWVVTAWLAAGCGGPSETPTSIPDSTLAGDVLATTADVSVGAILENPSAFLGQQVELSGKTVQSLGPMSQLFTDGTGAIPLDFITAPLPPVNETIVVTGTVTQGTGDFAARIHVITWEKPPAFSCEDIVEVRARFSDPGFVAGNVVGLYLAYRGVPAGMKTLEITWDEANPSESTESFEVGEGRPRDDGLFDLEGDVGHEYPGVSATVTKSVRIRLKLQGRDGSCTRVREVTVTKGTGPGFAAGGALRLSFNDPVPSGGFFSVTATVTNVSGRTGDATLLFQTPERSSIRTMGAGCEKLSAQLVSCIVRNVTPGASGDEFVQYDVPVVTKPLTIDGSVTLVARDFSPVANYRTTVAP